MALKTAIDVWKTFALREGFDKAFTKMVVNSASETKIQMQFTVTEELSNFGDRLHGGATATIADIVSTLGLVAAGRPRGVSINLSVNYLKGAAMGEEILVDSEIVKIGKTMAFLDVRLTKKEAGDLIATVSHIKHLGN